MIRQTLSFFPSIHQGIPNLRPLLLHFAMGWVLDVASIYTVLRVCCSLRCQFKYLPWSKLLAQPPPYFIHITHFPLFALAVTYWWPVCIDVVCSVFYWGLSCTFPLGSSGSEPAASAVLLRSLYSTSVCGSADRHDTGDSFNVWTFFLCTFVSFF